MRTKTSVLARTRCDMADDLSSAFRRVVGQEPPALTEIPALADVYLAMLGSEAVWAGPAFVFPGLPPVKAAVVEIGAHNADFLHGALAAWRADVGRRGPFVAIVEKGRVVSLCASVRTTRFVHCAGVETVPDRRGRGLAGQVVAAWAARVRARGAVPFYSTSWDNLASRAVARRLGLSLAGVDFHVG